MTWASDLQAALQHIAASVKHTDDCAIRDARFACCDCSRPQRILAAQCAAIERGLEAAYENKRDAWRFFESKFLQGVQEFPDAR